MMWMERVLNGGEANDVVVLIYWFLLLFNGFVGNISVFMGRNKAHFLNPFVIKRVVGSVVAIAFQIAFRVEKHVNNIFFIF